MWAIKSHKISKMWFSDPCISAMSSAVTNTSSHFPHPVCSQTEDRQKETGRFLYKGLAHTYTGSAHRKPWGYCISPNMPSFMILLALGPNAESLPTQQAPGIAEDTVRRVSCPSRRHTEGV